MSEVKVLLTCVGTQVAPGIISMIRRNRRYKVRVIGVDAGKREELVGRYFCDNFYTVPYARSKVYLSAIMDICKKENVRIVFPGSDEEALVLSRYKTAFDAIGVKVACADAASIKRSQDKLRLMEFLKRNGIRVAECCNPRSLAELERMCRRLGYPKKNVVIKPRVSRGSRGFRIITKSTDLYTKFCKNEFYYVSLAEILQLFRRRSKSLEGFFLMEYLGGKRYSVDVLMERSRPVACVCRRKIFPIGSPTQMADIVHDPDVIEYAKRVASLLAFDYFVQIEAGRDRYGRVCLIEVNPRIDATLPIVEGLNINYFEEMILYAIDGNFTKRDFKFPRKSVRFYRYWQHIFNEDSKKRRQRQVEIA